MPDYEDPWSFSFSSRGIANKGAQYFLPILKATGLYLIATGLEYGPSALYAPH
jgi:hypothetical protein